MDSMAILYGPMNNPCRETDTELLCASPSAYFEYRV